MGFQWLFVYGRERNRNQNGKDLPLIYLNMSSIGKVRLKKNESYYVNSKWV